MRTTPTTREAGAGEAGGGARRPAVTRACVITHGRVSAIGDGLSRLSCVAEGRGIELLFPEEERAKYDLRDLACRWSVGEGDDAELAIALGGDGTTLRALHRFLGRPTAVFAVNYGHFGFLTSALPDELERAVGRAFDGEYEVVELPTLGVECGARLVGLAINDAVVTSGAHGRMAHLDWSVDSVGLGRVRCDAIVVSTPAGSTGYSLSAGGPVVGWGLDALCATFVAPHSLAVRSFVLSSGQRIAVANAGEDLDARLVLDGHVTERALRPGESIEIRLAEPRARLALLPGASPIARFRDAFTLVGESAPERAAARPSAGGEARPARHRRVIR